MKYFFIIPSKVNIPRHHHKSSDCSKYPKKSTSYFVTLRPASLTHKNPRDTKEYPVEYPVCVISVAVLMAVVKQTGADPYWFPLFYGNQSDFS